VIVVILGVTAVASLLHTRRSAQPGVDG
jgi:hypothetical protein